jgi:hypothetical protein
MIDEEALSYKRGQLVQFRVHLGGGPLTCHGLVLNTAVLFGKGARQVWILDIEHGTPEQKERWVNKKNLVPENEIGAIIPREVIGADMLLRENPVCFPVKNYREERETPAVMVTISLPVAEQKTADEPKTDETK